MWGEGPPASRGKNVVTEKVEVSVGTLGALRRCPARDGRPIPPPPAPGPRLLGGASTRWTHCPEQEANPHTHTHAHAHSLSRGRARAEPGCRAPGASLCGGPGAGPLCPCDHRLCVLREYTAPLPVLLARQQPEFTPRTTSWPLTLAERLCHMQGRAEPLLQTDSPKPRTGHDDRPCHAGGARSSGRSAPCPAPLVTAQIPEGAAYSYSGDA